MSGINEDLFFTFKLKGLLILAQADILYYAPFLKQIWQGEVHLGHRMNNQPGVNKEDHIINEVMLIFLRVFEAREMIKISQKLPYM